MLKIRIANGIISGFRVFKPNDFLNRKVIKYKPELKYKNALDAHTSMKIASIRERNLPIPIERAS